MEVRPLPAEAADLIASIDRSEHVDREYEVVDGELRERPVTVSDVPA